MLYSVELANQRCYKAPLSLICDCKVITLFWNRQIFLPYFSKIIFQIQTLLSTGKCKIIDLSEENILGSVKI